MFNEGNDSGGSDGIESGGKPKFKRYFGCSSRYSIGLEHKNDINNEHRTFGHIFTTCLKKSIPWRGKLKFCYKGKKFILFYLNYISPYYTLRSPNFFQFSI